MRAMKRVNGAWVADDTGGDLIAWMSVNAGKLAYVADDKTAPCFYSSTEELAKRCRTDGKKAASFEDLRRRLAATAEMEAHPLFCARGRALCTARLPLEMEPTHMCQPSPSTDARQAGGI
jgi:hypothetical protein